MKDYLEWHFKKQKRGNFYANKVTYKTDCRYINGGYSIATQTMTYDDICSEIIFSKCDPAILYYFFKMICVFGWPGARELKIYTKLISYCTEYWNEFHWDPETDENRLNYISIELVNELFHHDETSLEWQDIDASNLSFSSRKYSISKMNNIPLKYEIKNYLNFEINDVLSKIKNEETFEKINNTIEKVGYENLKAFYIPYSSIFIFCYPTFNIKLKDEIIEKDYYNYDKAFIDFEIFKDKIKSYNYDNEELCINSVLNVIEANGFNELHNIHNMSIYNKMILKKYEYYFRNILFKKFDDILNCNGTGVLRCEDIFCNNLHYHCGSESFM